MQHFSNETPCNMLFRAYLLYVVFLDWFQDPIRKLQQSYVPGPFMSKSIQYLEIHTILVTFFLQLLLHQRTKCASRFRKSQHYEKLKMMGRTEHLIRFLLTDKRFCCPTHFPPHLPKNAFLNHYLTSNFLLVLYRSTNLNSCSLQRRRSASKSFSGKFSSSLSLQRPSKASISLGYWRSLSKLS